MVDKKKLQEKYVELQLLSMQIKQLEEQLNIFDQKTMELMTLRDSLQRLSELKTSAKSFAAIGPGIFVPGTVDASHGVLLNVGAGVVVKRTLGEAHKTIDAQMQQLDDITLELSTNLQALAVHAQKTESEIDALST